MGSLQGTELLAPAGNPERLRTAVYFGADAVYFAGKSYGLRAAADNLSYGEIAEATAYLHARGKKGYVAVNVFPHAADLDGLHEHALRLQALGVDAVIAADLGVIKYIKKHTGLAVHVSTQANVLNPLAARAYADEGVSRIVLARELTLGEIGRIADALPPSVGLEAFVHGAMCVSYSGRCLLSNYLLGRDGNNGRCAQPCRWKYRITEVSRGADTALEMGEDEEGTYILNSRDLNMLAHLQALRDVGVTAFKIEGRTKTAYYVATVTNAYRRALDGAPLPPLIEELNLAPTRGYTTGFYLGDGKNATTEDTATSKVGAASRFIAVVTEAYPGGAVVQMRNKFAVGDTLTVLSPAAVFLKSIKVGRLTDLDGNEVIIADRVCQLLRLSTDVPLSPGDMLRESRF
ncbi:MAG: U32 family peptidase [Clostridiales bacterium]|jgi:putative protease|nr:U32 family peptidase [Clostridiales bacterium]